MMVCITRFPLLPGSQPSAVRDINSCGVMVGCVIMKDGGHCAVMWQRVVGNPPVPICD